jgi:peptide methionine sulfoxide reductase MsrB
MDGSSIDRIVVANTVVTVFSPRCCIGTTSRHYAEHSGYYEKTSFLKEARSNDVIHFYDSNTGNLLFTAPQERSMEEFLQESRNHGWPSFRDAEVNWDYVRCLPGGEAVSVDGTHLGHNLPDGKGSRYCINLVSVAGNPAEAN